MTLDEILLPLRDREIVPFIVDMSPENLPTFDEKFVLPVTDEVYEHYLGQSPRWADRGSFVFGQGMDPFIYFWHTDGEYFGISMTHEQTEEFIELLASVSGDEPDTSPGGLQWRVECKHSGAGHDVAGNFDDAVRAAQAECSTDSSKWVVWAEPANVRMAEVTLRGAVWVKTRLTGDEVTKLMRRHKKTIAALSFVMGITQKRIREVRERGLEGAHAVRDWIQHITDEDPGPLPERYRVSGRIEEGDCCYCGCPLFGGDTAYEYANAMFCSVGCCRQSRNWGKEHAA